MQISNEDLNWLYFGNEEEQIIAKLTNEENKLIKFIENILMNNSYYDNINKVLTMFLTYLRNTEETHEATLIKSHMNEYQIRRLWQLDHKYGLLFNYDFKEKIKKQLIQKEHDTKIDIIKTILNSKGLIPFDITSRNREIDQFQPINLANKLRDQREVYKLYAKKIELWNYSHTWAEFDKLVNELLDSEVK